MLIAGLGVMRGMFRIRGRYWVPKIGLVIINDKSLIPNRTIRQANGAKKDKVKMFAIGVGKQFSKDELTKIANTPEDTLTIGDYKELSRQVQKLASKLCSLPDKEGKDDGGGFITEDPYVPIIPPSGRRRRQRVPGPDVWKGKGKKSLS